MAVKRRLSDLVSDLVPEEKPNVTELQSLEVAESITTEVSPNVSLTETELPELQSPKVTDSVTLLVPKYETFDRKEARLRADQTEGLTKLTKSINRKRKGRGERITDNTLIRIAVDLLLSKADVLEGTTEEEIRAVLNLRSFGSL